MSTLVLYWSVIDFYRLDCGTAGLSLIRELYTFNALSSVVFTVMFRVADLFLVDTKDEFGRFNDLEGDLLFEFYRFGLNVLYASTVLFCKNEL